MCLKGEVSALEWIKVTTGLGHCRALMPQGSSTFCLSLYTLPYITLQFVGIRTVPHTCDKPCFPCPFSRYKQQFNLPSPGIWYYIFKTEHELGQSTCKQSQIYTEKTIWLTLAYIHKLCVCLCCSYRNINLHFYYGIVLNNH